MTHNNKNNKARWRKSFLIVKMTIAIFVNRKLLRIKTMKKTEQPNFRNNIFSHLCVQFLIPGVCNTSNRCSLKVVLFKSEICTSSTRVSQFTQTELLQMIWRFIVQSYFQYAPLIFVFSSNVIVFITGFSIAGNVEWQVCSICRVPVLLRFDSAAFSFWQTLQILYHSFLS